MNKSSIFILFLVLATLFNLNAQSPQIKDPINLQKFTLSNGLTVLLSENPELPQVYGMVVVKAGGKNDPSDATGIAHYLEHMLFKGTQTMGSIDYAKEKPYLDSITGLYAKLGKTESVEERKKIQREINLQSVKAADFAIANELDKILAEMGSTGVNAFTTEEYTAYHNTFPSNQMERWLDVYSQRFINPVFRLFQSELETVYEEKNRMMDNGFSQAYEKFMASLYKVHPYGQQSIIGSTEHLKNPPLNKMYEFFEQFYVANNMALILCGDFKSENIMPIIEQKFSAWRSGVVPAYPEYKEEAFKGREVFEVKMTPIKAAVMGFRTVPNGHADLPALMVCNNLLSNEEQSGILDRLTTNGDVMATALVPMSYNDHGASGLIIVPKLLKQSIVEAEELVKAKLKLVQNGEFPMEMLEAVKLNIQKQQMSKWESNRSRVHEIAQAFSQGQDWQDYLSNINKIALVKKEDVIRVATQYYGKDYLLFVSKMGFPKKEKLEKPGFDPVIPKNEQKSIYYENWKQIGENPQNPKYVNVEEDINKFRVNNMVTVYATKNPYNDIFSAEIKWGVGTLAHPEIKYLVEYLNLAGSTEFPSAAFKEELYKLGCSFSFSSNDKELILRVEGIEYNFPGAITMLRGLIQNPMVDDKKLKKVRSDLAATNKIMKREPSYISEALQEYVLYGENSSYLRDLSKSKIKKLNVLGLLAIFDDVKNHEITVNYTGKQNAENVGSVFNVLFEKKKDIKPKTPTTFLDRNIPAEHTLYIVKKKKSVQTQLGFLIEGKSLNHESLPKIDAFNEYFGGNMSSIVFQEIREFRSLAYSAHAYYTPAKLLGKNNLFVGYIGCQGDKTIEAMDAMLGLINDMPVKKEREEAIRSALVQACGASRPEFRNILNTYEKWIDQQYLTDPNMGKSKVYPAINFDQIMEVYNNDIKGKPMFITVVGNPKSVKAKAFKKYGKVIKVKEKKLFAN